MQKKKRSYPDRSKYGNHKIAVDGITFDSIREARRYRTLKMFLDNGYITELEMQKPYVLIEAQRDANGKLLERKCTYRADFVYKDRDGNLVVEDTKGFKTKDYLIKRKLMLERYGIVIKEV